MRSESSALLALKNIYIIIILLSILRGGYAQNRTLVTKNFKFRDGVYYHFEQLQRNQPAVVWDSLETRLATNPQSLQMYIEVLKHKQTHDTIVLNSIWGVVVDGIPYVRLADEVQKKSAMTFAGMILRGKLFYYQYEDIEEKLVPITAYIPQTGQPYITKNVTQKKDIIREKLLKFETGETSDFTLFNFKQYIKEDADLLSTVNALKPKEVSEKLFKCLLIYNDRNPVFLK